jgi:hypothetical protein
MSLSRILNDEPPPVHSTRPAYATSSRAMPVDMQVAEMSPHSTSGRLSPTQYDRMGDSSRGYSYHDTESGGYKLLP